MISFVQLSEGDKRFIFALILVIILIFVIIWYLGLLITRVMKHQGKKLDNMVHDVLVTRVITEKKHFKKYANKKNWRYFYKKAAIPLLIMLVGSLVLIIGNVIMHDFSYNPFSSTEKGFASLLFLWDFSNPENYTQIFGMTFLAKWPNLIQSPHFEVNAIPSYLFVPCIIVGGVWYLVVCQAFIARQIRTYKLSNSVFDKNLDNFNQSNMYQNNNTNNNQY